MSIHNETPRGTETAEPHGAHDSHGDDHHGQGHGHDEDGGASHSTFKGYMTGFVLAVILTVIPFWLVMGKVFPSSSVTALVILGFAAVQMVVHMIYFLHMNTRSEGGWSLLALVFTLVLVVITLSGSIWVMYHLNHNMMPATMQDMKNMP
jgi:cytochrome o ubiquinol oxidase subunit IV